MCFVASGDLKDVPVGDLRFGSMDLPMQPEFYDLVSLALSKNRITKNVQRVIDTEFRSGLAQCHVSV